MRKFIDLLTEEESVTDLKKQVIGLVKQTDSEPILQRVLLALKSTDLTDRIKSALKTDKDASKILDRLARLIVNVDGSIEDKDRFAENYSQGFIDTAKLMDGRRHTFNQIIKDPFAEKVFRLLAEELTAQGVGPGELALAILGSKSISHTGRASGAGDLSIEGKSVEIKTTVREGGRWVNAREADLNMPAAKAALADALVNTDLEVPARLGIPAWVNTYRPAVPSEKLPELAKIMADALFAHTNNTKYKESLISGTSEEIKQAVLSVGYDNYKAYSKFDGMLIMDVRGEGAVQYFTEYEQMKDQITTNTIYLIAPESEAMPKVVLTKQGKIGQNTVSTDPAAQQRTSDIERKIQKISQRQPMTIGRDTRDEEPRELR